MIWMRRTSRAFGPWAVPACSRRNWLTVSVTRCRRASTHNCGPSRSSQPLQATLLAFKQGQEQLQSMPDGDAKVDAKKAQQQQLNDAADQARQITLLRAVYGSNQLKEQMVGFWLNHFSVFAGKGAVRLMAADYEEQ